MVACALATASVSWMVSKKGPIRDLLLQHLNGCSIGGLAANDGREDFGIFLRQVCVWTSTGGRIGALREVEGVALRLKAFIIAVQASCICGASPSSNHGKLLSALHGGLTAP